MNEDFGATLAEKQAFVRTAALDAVKGFSVMLGEGQIASIIAQVTNPHMRLSMSELNARAAVLAKNYVADIAAKPFNLFTATPQEIEAHRRAMGWPLDGQGANGRRVASMDNASGGGRPATSTEYNRSLPTGAASIGTADPTYLRSVGLGGMVGEQLKALGFRTKEQVAQVVADADKLHLDRRDAAVDLARLRKAEGDRTDGHVEALKRYGDGLRELEAERHEIAKIKDPKERAERERRAAEKEQKLEQTLKDHRDHDVRTPDGKKNFDKMRDKMRAQEHRRAALQGVQKADHDASQAELVAQNRRIGGERPVEEAHRKTVAELKKKPDTEQAERDLIAGALQDTRTAEKGPNPAPPNPDAPVKKERVAQADPIPKKAVTAEHKTPDDPQPTKPQRQAVNHKTLNPTV